MSMTEVRMLKIEEAAERLSVSKHTLNNWRSQGTGPTFYKIGGKVRYDSKDLDEFIESNKRAPTRQ